MNTFPVIVSCSIPSRKSAHGGRKARTATFTTTACGETAEQAVKEATVLFCKEDGYTVELVQAS